MSKSDKTIGFRSSFWF